MSMNLIPFPLKCLVGLVLFTGMGMDAFGQTATWNKASTGAWQDTANWTWTGTVPATSLPTSATTVLLNTTGAVITVRDTSQTAAAFTIQNGRLEVIKDATGGLLSVGNTFYIGSSVNTIGSVLVDGAGSILTKSATGQIHIGSAGNGSMVVSNGGRVDVGNATHIGYSGVGTLTVKTGGQFISVSTFILGYRGNGTMNVIEGGYVKSFNGYISGYGQDTNRTGGTAVVNVSGDGSKWDTGVMYVGLSGNGTLNVENNGQVVNTSTSFIGFLNGGAAAGAEPAPPIYGTGTVNVKTGGSWQSTGTVSIGTSGGTGTLNLASQGRVNVGGGNGSIVLGAAGRINIGSDPLLPNAVPDAPGLIMAGHVTSAEVMPRPLNLFHSDLTGNYYLTATGAAAGKPLEIRGSIQLNAMTGTTILPAANTFTGGTNIGGNLTVPAKITMNHTNSLSSGAVVVMNNGILEVPSTLNYATLSVLTLQGGSALSFDAHPIGGNSVPKFNITTWLELPFESGEKIKIYLNGAEAITNPELYDWAFLRTSVGVFGNVTDMFEVISDVPGFYVYESSGSLMLGMAVIPEPGRAVLLLAGLLGLGLRRRR